jgi:hypothetical protein
MIRSSGSRSLLVVSAAPMVSADSDPAGFAASRQVWWRVGVAINAVIDRELIQESLVAIACSVTPRPPGRCRESAGWRGCSIIVRVRRLSAHPDAGPTIRRRESCSSRTSRSARNSVRDIEANSHPPHVEKLRYIARETNSWALLHPRAGCGDLGSDHS